MKKFKFCSYLIRILMKIIKEFVKENFPNEENFSLNGKIREALKRLIYTLE